MQMQDSSALIVMTYQHDIVIIEYIESLLPFRVKIWSTLVHVSNIQVIHSRTSFLLSTDDAIRFLSEFDIVEDRPFYSEINIKF